MNIFEIEESIAKLYDSLIDEDGNVNDEVVKAIESLTGEREKKIENTALFVKQMDYDIKALREEKKRIDSRIRQKQRTADYLKGLLMGTLEGERFESPRVKVTFRKSKKVEISDDFVPFCKANGFEDYYEEVVDFKTDKNKLKKAITSGEIPAALLDHCNLIENKNVIIR